MKILTHAEAVYQIEKLRKKGIVAMMKPKLDGYIVVERLDDEQEPMFI